MPRPPLEISAPSRSDLELLRVRAEGLGGPEASLRGVRFMMTASEAVCIVGESVPPRVASELRLLAEQAGPWRDPAAAPPALAACRKVLETEGWSVESSVTSLVYLLEPSVECSVDVVIERSDRAAPRWLREANPGNWQPIEWDELLDGRLGPWTMAALDGRVSSICHAPVPMTEAFAEVGVWTDPEYRGRGHAAATTAAWARLLGGTGRHLFYGTELDNHSSQRVAQRLGLRLLGYEARLVEARDDGDRSVHPLSVLRHR